MYFEAILDVDIIVCGPLAMSYFHPEVQNKLFSVRTLIFGLNFHTFLKKNKKYTTFAL